MANGEPVCEHCRYWRFPYGTSPITGKEVKPRWIPDTYGCCERLSVGYDRAFHDDPIAGQTPCLIGFDDRGRMAAITTAPYFGCTSFEPKV